MKIKLKNITSGAITIAKPGMMLQCPVITDPTNPLPKTYKILLPIPPVTFKRGECLDVEDTEEIRAYITKGYLKIIS